MVTAEVGEGLLVVEFLELLSGEGCGAGKSKGEAVVGEFNPFGLSEVGSPGEAVGGFGVWGVPVGGDVE